MPLLSKKPEYRIQLPLTKKRVAFTAFTMRTERTLMLATQSEDTSEITAAICNCIDDHLRTDGIKARELPQAEAELLLLNMRAKSVGETVDISITDPEDGKQYPVKINLTEIGVTVDKDFNDTIEMADKKVVKFKIPSMEMLEKVDQDGDDFDSTINFLALCLESILDPEEDEEYMRQDLSETELHEYYLDLDTGDFSKISEQFFALIPALNAVVKTKKADGTSLEVEISGLASFL